MEQYQYPMPMPTGAPPMAPMPNIFAAYAQPVAMPRGPVQYSRIPADSDSDSDSDDNPCMTRKTLLAVALAVAVVLIIVILYYMFSPRTLAKGLARCGWIVYYRQGCGYCTKQKHVLGGKFHKYIECDTSGNQIGGYTTSPPLPCNSPTITGFPFWYNTRTKETRVGLQDAGSLEKMAQW